VTGSHLRLTPLTSVLLLPLQLGNCGK
jgi:hypothetical protein